MKRLKTVSQLKMVLAEKMGMAEEEITEDWKKEFNRRWADAWFFYQMGALDVADSIPNPGDAVRNHVNWQNKVDRALPEPPKREDSEWLEYHESKGPK